jgi:cytochrome c551/c552
MVKFTNALLYLGLLSSLSSCVQEPKAVWIDEKTVRFTQNIPPDLDALMREHNCYACHKKTSGNTPFPSIQALRERYGSSPNKQLTNVIMQGGQGRWGRLPMPPSPKLSRPDAEKLSAWFNEPAYQPPKKQNSAILIPPYLDALMQGNDCYRCHKKDGNKSLSIRAIRDRYISKPQKNPQALAAFIKNGTKKKARMPSSPKLTLADAEKLSAWFNGLVESHEAIDEKENFFYSGYKIFIKPDWDKTVAAVGTVGNKYLEEGREIDRRLEKKKGVQSWPIIGAFLLGIEDGVPAAKTQVGDALKEAPQAYVDRKTDEYIDRQKERQEQQKREKEERKRQEEAERITRERREAQENYDRKYAAIQARQDQQRKEIDEQNRLAWEKKQNEAQAREEDFRKKQLAEQLKDIERAEQIRKQEAERYERSHREELARSEIEQQRLVAAQHEEATRYEERKKEAQENSDHARQESLARADEERKRQLAQSQVVTSIQLVKPSSGAQQNQTKAYIEYASPMPKIEQNTSEPITPIPFVNQNSLTSQEVMWKKSLPSDIRQKINQFSPDMISRMKKSGQWSIFVQGVNNDVTSLQETRGEEAVAWGQFAFDVVTLPVGELKVATLAISRGPAIAIEAIQAGKTILKVASEKGAGKSTARELDATAGDGINNGQSTISRPTPRQSEVDVGANLPANARPQVSYKNSQEVPYSTKGSVRPDWCIGNVCSIEVKNFNVATNQAGLIDSISRQAIQRAANLPQGMTQQVVIDVRGQTITVVQQREIIRGIVQRSNGAINPESISFLK